MATITSRKTIETMLANDGVYPGDPQPWAIFEYRHGYTGKIMWAVFWDHRHFDLAGNRFVARYKLLWDCNDGHHHKIGVLDEQEKAQAQEETA